MNNKEKFEKYFCGKSVLIMGFGTEGRSTLDFLTKYFPDCRIAIYDKNVLRLEKNIRFITGEIDHIHDKFDLIIKSPGIPLPDGFVQRYKAVISSQTDIFLRELQAQKAKVQRYLFFIRSLQTAGKTRYSQAILAYLSLISYMKWMIQA